MIMRASYKLFVLCLPVLLGCNLLASTTEPAPVSSPTAPRPSQAPAASPSPADLPTRTPAHTPLPLLSITLGTLNNEQGITLDAGGDVDTRVMEKGTPARETRQTGNGLALPAADGNSVQDYYMQFNVDDARLRAGAPTRHVRLVVEYFDEGFDSFSLEYDAVSGTFAGGGSVVKTNSFTFKQAAFNLCDAYFDNRDNGADFRLSDNGDGAESIARVQVIPLAEAGAQTINVDDFGAYPYDEAPDSDAIQAALDSTCSGDTVVFSSPSPTPGYRGYRIDKTLFLTGLSAKQDLTFTSSNPAQHAQLTATADLQGFVVRLFARSRVNNPGFIDNIDFGYIDIDGSRELRTCMGADQVTDGVGDNWGSWLPECSSVDDPWCLPGVLGMDGSMDWEDPAQDYAAYPERWTTGVVVHDALLSNGECGTALAFSSAAGWIERVTIDTAGDHVHAAGCAFTDPDGDRGAWSDGITLSGPGHTVQNNTVINPSDIGIVYFGGKDTVISGNTIQIEAGNYGAFGGIALHPWIFGDISGLQITGNVVSSLGDQTCGGLHAGINLGTHMWGGACLASAAPTLYGNPGACLPNPPLDGVTACTGGRCQVWAYLPAGATATLRDNSVSGAHINYLVEGFAILGTFVDENNTSLTPRRSDWQAAREGCEGLTWGPLDKVAHHPALPGYLDLMIHCER
jgi:hypothetical protein